MITQIKNRIATFPPGLRQMAVYAMAPVIAKAISFIMVPVFTHYLAPEDYGRLDILQTLADLLSIVIGLGLADTLFRFAGSATDPGERKKAAANLFGLSLVTGALFVAATQMAAPWIAGLLPGDADLLQVRIILASLSFSAVILVPLSWLRLQGHAGLYVFGTGGRAVVQAAAVALLLSLGFGVTGVLVAGMASCVLLATILIIAQLRQTGIRFDVHVWHRHLRFGYPLVLAGMAAFIMSSCDRWFVAAYSGTEIMATYAVAAKFGLIVAMIFQPFEMWWAAKRYEILQQEGGEARLARYSELGGLVLGAAVIMVASAGPLLITWMTPQTYHAAAGYLPWLALIAALRSAGTLVNIGLMVGHGTLRVLAIEAVSAGLAVLLFLVFIPHYGAWGAIAATGMTLGLRLMATYLLAQHARRLPMRLTGFALAASAALLTVAVASSADTAWHSLAAGGLGMTLLLVGTLAISVAPGILRARSRRRVPV